MAKKEKKVKDKEKKQKSHYFKDMKAELKKVIWPSAKQTINNTMAVIVFALVAAVIVFVLDVCFDSLNKYAITPLQEKVQSSYQASQEENESTESEEESTKKENSSDEETVDEDSVNVEVESENSEAENTNNE